MKNKNEFSFADFVKELKASSETGVVKEVESRPERQYFLIVSEGARTEPLYFEYFKEKLPKDLLDTIEIIGEGANTVSVVERAIKEKSKREQSSFLPNFDKVWAVFDKDDFSANRVTAAMAIAAQNSIQIGYSNQSFELWYILHFQYLDAALHREQYYPILSQALGMKYIKNNKQIVKRIFALGDVRAAISNAKKLMETHGGALSWDACPVTTIHELVEELIVYCDF